MSSKTPRNSAPNLGMIQSHYAGMPELVVDETMIRITPATLYLDNPQAFAPGFSKIDPYGLLMTALDIVNKNAPVIRAAAVAVASKITVMPINADRLIIGNLEGKLGAHLCMAPMDMGVPVGIISAAISQVLIANAIGVEVGYLSVDTTMMSYHDPSFRNRMNASRDRGFFPLVRKADQWLNELTLVLQTQGNLMGGFHEGWFRKVLGPLREASGLTQTRDFTSARARALTCSDEGWRTAMLMHIECEEKA